MKKTFVNPEIEIIVLSQSEDILTTSWIGGIGGDPENDEGPDW